MKPQIYRNLCPQHALKLWSPLGRPLKVNFPFTTTVLNSTRQPKCTRGSERSRGSFWSPEPGGRASKSLEHLLVSTLDPSPGPGFSPSWWRIPGPQASAETYGHMPHPVVGHRSEPLPSGFEPASCFMNFCSPTAWFGSDLNAVLASEFSSLVNLSVPGSSLHFQASSPS